MLKISRLIKLIRLDFLRPSLNHVSPWWVEIITANPGCIYYFGPFDSALEAEVAYPGYIEDLANEGAEGIVSQVKRCNPQVLTLCQEGA